MHDQMNRIRRHPAQAHRRYPAAIRNTLRLRKRLRRILRPLTDWVRTVAALFLLLLAAWTAVQAGNGAAHNEPMPISAGDPTH